MSAVNEKLRDWERAVNRAATSRNLDGISSEHTLIALLEAQQNGYKGKLAVERGDNAGGPYQVNLRVGLPVVNGVRDRTGDLADLSIPDQKNHTMVSTTLDGASYHALETVKKHDIEKLKSKESAYDHIEEILDSFEEAWNTRLDEHLVPSTTVSAVNGPPDEDRVMAIAYLLQNLSTGSYMFGGINLADAAYANLRALVVGDTTNGGRFGTFTLSAFRRRLYLPLRNNRKSQADIALCDTKIYDYILTQGEAKVQLDQQADMDYGFETVKFGAVRFAAIERLDTLGDSGNDNTTNYREVYLLNGRFWRWERMNTQPVVIRNVPNRPAIVNVQEWSRRNLICRLPRKNARAVGVITA